MSDVEPSEPRPAASSPQRFRAGDGDRDEVADRLRTAAAEGRIDPGELVRRLDLAYAARTYGELEALLADLVSELIITTPSGNLHQGGRWRIPRRIVVRCTSGLFTVDFTEAVSFHREVTVEATCGSGWITLIVPRGWSVLVDAASTNLVHVKNRASSLPTPGDPTLTVRAHPGLGYVRIRHPRS